VVFTAWITFMSLVRTLPILLEPSLTTYSDFPSGAMAMLRGSEPVQTLSTPRFSATSILAMLPSPFSVA